MNEQDKAAQRANVVYQFGIQMGPLTKLAEASNPPRAAEYHVAVAQARHDYQNWTREVYRFATVGQYTFQHIANDILQGLNHLINEMSNMAMSNRDDASRQSALKVLAKMCRDGTLAAIDQMPIEWTARLLAQGTQFSTYLAIRDALATAKTRMHYFDRYLDVDFFNVYLRDISRSIEIRLVTTRGNVNYGVTNVQYLSALASAEFTNYKLIQCMPDDLHDRNLRIDDKVFHLGTSIKDAGDKPTNFALGDSTSHGHSVLDAIMQSGTEVA